MLSPSWLVDLVSSVKKRTPSPEPRNTQTHSSDLAVSIKSCNTMYMYWCTCTTRMYRYVNVHVCFKFNTNSRLNLDATSQATHAPQQSSLYNSCVQSGAQQYQFGSSALSQLTKLDARTSAQANGKAQLFPLSCLLFHLEALFVAGMPEQREMAGFSARPTAFTQSAATIPCSSTASVALVRENINSLSRIEQMRKELGGSITPSKEIEERALTQQCKTVSHALRENK